MTYKELKDLLDQAESACTSGNKEKAKILASKALEILKILSDTSDSISKKEAETLLAGSFVRLASNHLEHGDVETTLWYAEPALEITNTLGADQIRADLLNIIGVVHVSSSEYYRALEYFQKALTLNTALGNQKMMAGNYHNIGDIYQHFTEYSTSLDYLQKALKINEEIGNRRWLALNLARIALVYTRLSDYPHAMEYFSQALSLQEEFGNQQEVAGILINMSLVYQKLGNYSGAIEIYHQVLGKTESMGKTTTLASIYINLGAAYLSLLDYTTALEYFHKALAIAQDVGAKEVMAACNGSIGEVYCRSDFEGYSVEKAEEFLFKAIGVFEEMDDRLTLYELHEALALMYEHEKRWEDFAVHFKKYHTLEKKAQSDENKKSAEKYAQERKAAEYNKALAVERALSQATNDILANILPQNITDRLLRGEKKIADSYENVSVLFADTVGFTQLSSQLPAEELIDILDIVFTRFDTICKKYGLEKIKTIGDAYMAVCGAPEAILNHAECTALVALEMLEDFSIEQRFSVPINLGFRIGLHSGSVVAGIIGENKYSYDLWGDAVNTASRMESHGEEDKIHVSEEFRNMLISTTHNELPMKFIPRGEMNIKGKGMMKTYFLEKA